MKKVDIYTSNGCSYCHAAMEYLTEHNIEFTEHNIASDPEAKKDLIKMGYRSVPVIIVDEKDIVLGFEKDKIDSLLNL